MNSFASTLDEQVAVKKVDENEFVSIFNPDKMGNVANIAYGGCTIAVGVSAAYQTVSSQYHIYTILGNYLGPTLTDRKMYCQVTSIRETRTFATRQVLVSQDQNDGTRRPCLVLLADFQTQEPTTMLSYSTPPFTSYSSIETSLTREEMRGKLLKEGKITPKMAAIHKKTFGLLERYFDAYAAPESIFTQNLYGMAKEVQTTQDHLPLTSKTSAEWGRASHPLKTEAAHVAGVSFYMDGALSFIPLSHSHLFLQDAGACSSLDFSLRILSNKVNLNEWHLKEMRTIHGGEGRTYSEARMWDLQGNMVACMTQQNILRPKPPPKAAL